MTKYLEKGVNAIIRPPRKEYDTGSIPFAFECTDGKYIREPMNFVNRRGQQIVGSLYHKEGVNPVLGGPCVIYLHGNCSSQLEGNYLMPNFCRHNICMYCFDFTGSGNSDGKYISLGWYEKEDTEFVMESLKKAFGFGPFVLWGRSMGAATALLVDSPHVAGKICDSAFTSVKDMCCSIANSMNFPKAFVSLVISILKRKVVNTANFNLDDVSPLNAAMKATIPIMFGHAEDDEFIPFEQCERLYNAYATNEKYMVPLENGHNGKRDGRWVKLCVQFALERLGIKCENPYITNAASMFEVADFHFKSFADMFSKTRDPEKEVEEALTECAMTV